MSAYIGTSLRVVVIVGVQGCGDSEHIAGAGTGSGEQNSSSKHRNSITYDELYTFIDYHDKGARIA